MEEQKKVLILSVLVTAFFTAFIVSLAMFYLFYKTKNIDSDNQSYIVKEENLNDYDDETVEKDLKETKSEVEYNDSKEDESLKSNEDMGSPEFISKEMIVWNKLRNMGNLGFFANTTESFSNKECTGNYINYYLAGKVNSGIYKNFNFYVVDINECSDFGDYNYFVRILSDGRDVVFFKGYDKFEESDLNKISNFQTLGGKNKIINGDIRVEGLNLPKKLVSDNFYSDGVLHDLNYHDVFFKNESFNILKEAFSSEYGEVWMTDVTKSKEIYSGKKDKTKEDDENYALFDTNAFYIKLPDGTVASYKLSLEKIANYSNDYDYSRVDVNAVWNDGKEHHEEYEVYPHGCGTTSYAYDMTDVVNKDELKRIGKFENGKVIFGFRDTSHPLFKKLYEDIYHAKDGKKKSEEEFLQDHPQIFWIDPFGRILTFYSTDIISPAECGKPVIYLYPEEEMNVHVQVFPGNGFTITDPDYGENGWFVKATPESVLTNYADNEEYPYLFWEGRGDELYIKSRKGFVVSQDELGNFFDEKLLQLGLNDQEIFDFKEFWVPKMKEENKKYYFVTFLPQGFINDLAPLKVEPKPDSVIRILMDYEGLDEYKDVEELKIVTPERKGFTLVEWGGMLH